MKLSPGHIRKATRRFASILLLAILLFPNTSSLSGNDTKDGESNEKGPKPGRTILRSIPLGILSKGDVDGDKKTELVVSVSGEKDSKGAENKEVQIYEVVRGTFDLSWKGSIPSPGRVSAMRLNDFDGKGLEEIFLALCGPDESSTPSISVVKKMGKNLLVLPPAPLTGKKGCVSSIEFADTDGDGAGEMIILTDKGSTGVFATEGLRFDEKSSGEIGDGACSIIAIPQKGNSGTKEIVVSYGGQLVKFFSPSEKGPIQRLEVHPSGSQLTLGGKKDGSMEGCMRLIKARLDQSPDQDIIAFENPQSQSSQQKIFLYGMDEKGITQKSPPKEISALDTDTKTGLRLEGLTTGDIDGNGLDEIIFLVSSAEASQAGKAAETAKTLIIAAFQEGGLKSLFSMKLDQEAEAAGLLALDIDADRKDEVIGGGRWYRFASKETVTQASKTSPVEEDLWKKEDTQKKTKSNLVPAGKAETAHKLNFKEDRNLSQLRWGQYSGRIILIEFWATWCGSCRKFQTALNSIHSSYGGKGLVVIGASEDSNEKTVANYIEKYSVPYPVARVPKSDREAYSLNGVPSFVLIDRMGRVRYKGTGGSNSMKDRLSSMIEELL